MMSFPTGSLSFRSIIVISWMLLGFSGAQLFGQAPTELSTAELIKQLASRQGEARTELQLALLKRLDAPVDVRDRACDELIERFKEQDNPAVLGQAYSGKGKVLGDRLDFAAAVKMLEIAEGYGRRCADVDPGIFFKSICNRAVYLSAQSEREEPVRLLREAIEYAKPYEDALDVPFAYAMLGRLAEASGAIDKAFEYLQLGFESAARSNKSTLAAQAGISILELALSEKKPELASEWLVRLEPWVEKSSDPRTKFLLALRREDLRRMQGDPTGAAEAVQRLIDQQPPDADAQSLGVLYLSLAACHFEAKNYEAAIAASKKGGEILKPIFRSWTLTQMNLIESEFALGKDEEALTEVDDLLNDPRQVAAIHRIGLLALKSRILAKLDLHEESLAALQACRELEGKRATDRAQEIAHFIGAAYDGQQREAALSMAQARQQAAEYQAELHKEVAMRERSSSANDRFVKNVAIVASLLGIAISLLLIRAHSNRRAALMIAARERELNDHLQDRLARQAVELKEETQARQQLELAVERKFRDEALGKLTGGVAHDFNNLLTVVVHSADLLQRQNPQLAEDSIQLLEAINNAAESGSTIVSQLMAYTRQQPLEPQPIRIADWIASTRTMLKQSVGKSIQLSENDQSGEALICIDAAQLTTAVINLLANARDAIRPGSGTIEFNIRCLTLDCNSSDAWPTLSPGEYALFEVIDSGKGMSSDELAHACEPFFTTKPTGAGTGLGLSTVLGFVKQSGGDLRLSSQPGAGTRVSFCIPLIEDKVSNGREGIGTGLSPAERSPAERTGAVMCEAASSKYQPHSNMVASDARSQSQLLLVEDQEAVRTVLAAGLKSIGYEVTQAGHAEEAMAIMSQTGAPKILLSDVRMPGSMDGVQLRRWVLERFPGVHVVLMSGYRDLETDEDSQEQILFLQKPVKLQELHRALSMQ